MADYQAGTASIKVSPNMSRFADDLRARLRTIDADFAVDVSADTTSASAALAAWTAQQRAVDVDVNLNSLGAEISLDYLTRDRTIDLDLQLNPAQLAQIQAQIAALGIGEIGIQATRAAGGVSSLGSVAGIATTALAGLVAVSFIPLIASASQALGVVALLPAVAAGAGAGIATLGVGLSGITGAFSAMSEGASGAGGAAEDMGHQTAQAAERVEEAKLSLRNAEENLADAQNDARQASNELNESYAEGVRQLQDMNDQLESAQLSTEGAALAVARARQNLAETNTDPEASGLDRAEADLRYRQAVQRLDEQRRETNELAADTAKANREGVAGTEAVTSATERYNNANQAQETAAQQVRQAQNALTEALYQQSNASTSAAGGVDKFAEAMAKLSPNAQDFVLKMRELSSAWTDLRKSVQDRLFDGLGDSITDLANNYFPLLKTGMGEIATQFNGGLKQIFAEMATPRVKDQWSQILNNTSIAVGNLMGAFSNMGRAFTTIASVGSTFLPGLTGGLENATDRFADWIDKLADNGKLHQFIQDAIDKFGTLWDIGDKVLTLIGNIFRGAKPEGDSMLTGIGETLDRWNTFLGSEEGQEKLRKFFEEVRNTVSDILSLIETSIKLIDGMAQVMEFLGLMPGQKDNPEGTTDSNKSAMNSGRLKDENGNTVDSKGNPAWNPGEDGPAAWFPVVPKPTREVEGQAVPEGGGAPELTKQSNAAAAAQESLSIKTRGAWDSMSSFISEKWTQSIAPTLGNFGSGAVNLGATAAREIGGRAVDAWNSLSGGASRVAAAVQGKLSELVGFFAGLPGRLGGIIENVVSGPFGRLQSGATSVKDSIVTRFDELVSFFTGIGPRIAAAATNMWDGLKDSFKGVLNSIVSAWNTLGDRLSFTAPKSFLGVPIPEAVGGGKKVTILPHIDPLATGGMVRGPGGPRTDSILGVDADGVPTARVSAGEYVVNAAATAANLPLLNAINGGLPGFASGGQVGAARSYAESMVGTPYAMGGFGPGGIDCSGLVSAVVNVLMGLDAYDSRMSTPSEGAWLTAKGFSLGMGGPGDVRIGWWDGGTGGFSNGHTAGTFDDGTNFESGGNSGPVAVGGSTGYNDPQFDQHAFFTVAATPFPNFLDPSAPGVDPGSSNPWGAEGASPEGGMTGSYSGSTPTTWSGFAGDFAQKAGTILAKGALDFFGINDEIPPIVKGVQEYNQFRAGQSQPPTSTAGVDNTGDTGLLPPTAAPAPAAVAPTDNTPQGAVKRAFQPLGWDTGANWDATDWIVGKESTWNPLAENPSSGAFGLFQFNPSSGTLQEYLPDRNPDAFIQGQAGGRYIGDRYGTPVEARTFWEANGWYANGGPVIGPGGPRDDAIPAFLSNGEYVVNAPATAANLPILEAINSGQKVGSASVDRSVHFHGDNYAQDSNEFMRTVDRKMSLATMGTMGALPG